MTYNSKTVKDIIKTFIEEHVDESEALATKSGQKFVANKTIFELESYLVQLRNAYQINERIDTSIFSENILAHFNKIDAANAFLDKHYEYNFLHHLAVSYEPNKELHILIDEFITKFKNQFTLADIVITASGATRCKTNIRFALINLRDFGLVLSRDRNSNRSWSPSLIGLIALLNIQFCKPDSISWDYYREPMLLPKKQKKSFACVNDPLLWQSLSQFKKPDFIYSYLTWQHGIALDDSEKKILESIINKYIDFTHEGLEITNDGVKETKKFKELSKEFQNNLFTIHDSNPLLLEKLFQHFRQKK